jgi:hypothetical protein
LISRGREIRRYNSAIIPYFYAMLKPILSLLLFICCLGASAQTARIAHRSHSGSDARFRFVNDNFGLRDPYPKKAPAPAVKQLPKDAAGSAKSKSPAPQPRQKKPEAVTPKKKTAVQPPRQ